jgi:hypothetical protein
VTAVLPETGAAAGQPPADEDSGHDLTRQRLLEHVRQFVRDQARHGQIGPAAPTPAADDTSLEPAARSAAGKAQDRIMVTTDLDDATFAIVRNAVQMAVGQTREQHRQLNDEHVLHIHHRRAVDAERTAEMRDLTAGTVRDYEHALQALDGRDQPPSGARSGPASDSGTLCFTARLTATIHASGRSLGDAVDALHGMQAHAPRTPVQLAEG